MAASDRTGAYPAAKVDRSIFQATIYHCMGLDLSEHIRDPLGRTYIPRVK